MEMVYMILFQFLRENQENETNVQIAQILIKNLNDVKHMSLEATALLCHCSPSTLSRFCQLLGFKNFKLFRTILNRPQLTYPTIDFNQQSYLEHIQENLKQTDLYLKQDKINNLILSIHNAKRIVMLGFQIHQSFTLEFQCKMMMLNKYIEIANSLDVIEKINTLTKDDLVIIISFNGNFFVGQEHILEKLKQKNAKIILIGQYFPKEYSIEIQQFIECGHFSFYGEGSYSLIYILNIIVFKYHEFLNQ